MIPLAPWENRSGESFYSRLRDELFDVDEIVSLADLWTQAKSDRRGYDEVRLPSSLGYETRKAFIVACVGDHKTRSD